MGKHTEITCRESGRNVSEGHFTRSTPRGDEVLCWQCGRLLMRKPSKPTIVPRHKVPPRT